MSDRGHELTDGILEELEGEIKNQYRKAVDDVEQKLRDYLEKTEKGRLEQKALLDAGQITKKQYNDWVYRHTMVGKRWEAMRDSLASDLVHADAVAMGMIKGKMPDVYALNKNYGTYQIEHDGLLDTGFELYNRDSAAYLLSDQRELMPGPSSKKAAQIRANKDMQWNMRHVQSAVLQGILQGESPYDVAARLRQVGRMDASASIRYARTMTTSAQNAGRYDAFRRAKGLGVQLTIEWQATLDGRTRHEHRMMHGQRREVDEPFEVEGIKILYPAEGGPGGSDIPQRLIWNCRCTLLSWVKGFEGDTVKSSPKMGDMSFEEWRQEKASKGSEKSGARRKSPEGLESLSRIYVNHEDKLYRYLQKVDPIEGYEDFAIHGVPGKPLVEMDTNTGISTQYTAQEFADMLRQDPSYGGGKIRLLSCGAGSDSTGFAQELANYLRQDVMAPTETLWVAENGELFISDNDILAEMWYNNGEIDNTIKQTGKMKVFSPE